MEIFTDLAWSNKIYNIRLCIVQPYGNILQFMCICSHLTSEDQLKSSTRIRSKTTPMSGRGRGHGHRDCHDQISIKFQVLRQQVQTLEYQHLFDWSVLWVHSYIIAYDCGCVFEELLSLSCVSVVLV